MGKKSSFAKDVLKLASGTTAAQVVGILIIPLIARLFSPETIGVAALYSSVLGPLSVVACLRYENAIPLPEQDHDALNVVTLCLYLVLIVSALSVPLILFGGVQITHALNAPKLKEYLWLLPISLFLAGLLLVLQSWHTRKRQFGRLTVAQFAFSSGTVGAQLSAGLLGYTGVGSLIGAGVLGGAASCTILGAKVWRGWSSLFFSGAGFRKALFALKRYRRFPQYNIASSLLNNASWQMPAIVLAAFFSTSVVGQYALGYRLLRVPMSLIGVNISKVFYQRAAEARITGNLHVIIQSVLRYMIMLTMFPLFLLALVGKDLFVVVLGSRWAEAGVYAQILTPSTFAWFISIPMNDVLSVLEKQHVELHFQALMFATRAVSTVAGGLLGDPRTALAFMSASDTLVYGLYCTAVLRKRGLPTSEIVKALISNSGLVIPAVVIIAALKYTGTSPLIIVMAALMFLLLNYFKILWQDPQARDLLSSLVAPANAAGV